MMSYRNHNTCVSCWHAPCGKSKTSFSPSSILLRPPVLSETSTCPQPVPRPLPCPSRQPSPSLITVLVCKPRPEAPDYGGSPTPWLGGQLTQLGPPGSAHFSAALASHGERFLPTLVPTKLLSPKCKDVKPYSRLLFDQQVFSSLSLFPSPIKNLTFLPLHPTVFFVRALRSPHTHHPESRAPCRLGPRCLRLTWAASLHFPPSISESLS